MKQRSPVDRDAEVVSSVQPLSGLFECGGIDSFCPICPVAGASFQPRRSACRVHTDCRPTGRLHQRPVGV